MREGVHVPYGRYQMLLPHIQELVVHFGVGTRAISEVFGLNRKTVTSRMSEMEAFEERYLRDRELAQKMLFSLIQKGVLSEAEYRHRLDPVWQKRLEDPQVEAERVLVSD